MTILNRYNKKALQQMRRRLHISLDGTKAAVVRRLTAHMVDYVQLAAEGFGHASGVSSSAGLGMSQHFRSEGCPARKAQQRLEEHWRPCGKPDGS